MSVSEALLHDFGVNTLRQRERRARMPQLVETDRRQASGFRQFPERRAKRVSAQHVAGPVCEDEAVVLPELPEPESLRILPHPMLA